MKETERRYAVLEGFMFLGDLEPNFYTLDDAIDKAKKEIKHPHADAKYVVEVKKIVKPKQEAIQIEVEDFHGQVNGNGAGVSAE